MKKLIILISTLLLTVGCAIQPKNYYYDDVYSDRYYNRYDRQVALLQFNWMLNPLYCPINNFNFGYRSPYIVVNNNRRNRRGRQSTIRDNRNKRNVTRGTRNTGSTVRSTPRSTSRTRPNRNNTRISPRVNRNVRSSKPRSVYKSRR